MKDILELDKKQNREQLVADFTSLLKHPGFIKLKMIIDANIEVLDQQLKNGFEGETYEELKELRNKINIHNHFINTPERMINQLTSKDEQILDNDDPYIDVGDLEIKKISK